MLKMPEQVKRRWIYCADYDRPYHKGKKSVYYVEVHTGSNVIATIAPVGLCKEESIEHEVTMFTLRNNLSTAGGSKPSKRHTRLRAVVGTNYGSESA